MLTFLFSVLILANANPFVEGQFYFNQDEYILPASTTCQQASDRFESLVASVPHLLNYLDSFSFRCSILPEDKSTASGDRTLVFFEFLMNPHQPENQSDFESALTEFQKQDYFGKTFSVYRVVGFSTTRSYAVLIFEPDETRIYTNARIGGVYDSYGNLLKQENAFLEENSKLNIPDIKKNLESLFGVTEKNKFEQALSRPGAVPAVCVNTGFHLANGFIFDSRKLFCSALGGSTGSFVVGPVPQPFQ